MYAYYRTSVTWLRYHLSPSLKGCGQYGQSAQAQLRAVWQQEAGSTQARHAVQEGRWQVPSRFAQGWRWQQHGSQVVTRKGLHGPLAPSAAVCSTGGLLNIRYTYLYEKLYFN